MADGEWTVKVRRNGGGFSIIDIQPDKESAEKLAEEFNTYYQVDNYYVEPYKAKNEYSYNKGEN